MCGLEPGHARRLGSARSRRRFWAIGALGWLGACSSGQPALVDLATLQRPASPNTYLVCPRAVTTASIDREPPTWPVPVEVLERTWLEALAAEPRVTPVAADAQRHRHLLVQRTPVLRFPDVIQLDVLPVEPGGATVCLYGRSVYGYSDFGKNRRRIEDWLARIKPPAS